MIIVAQESFDSSSASIINSKQIGSFNDFLMNTGLNLVSNPPSGNILQTVAKEAQGPFQQLQRARAQERSADRSLASDWLKTNDISAIAYEGSPMEKLASIIPKVKPELVQSKVYGRKQHI